MAQVRNLFTSTSKLYVTKEKKKRKKKKKTKGCRADSNLKPQNKK
jgi:hypothetical protein